MSHKFIVSYNEKGTYVATSASSPYFCFEGSSEEEVADTARRALNFYHEASGNVSRVTSEPKTITTSRYKSSHVFNSSLVA